MNPKTSKSILKVKIHLGVRILHFVLNFWNKISNKKCCLNWALFKPLKRFQKLNIKIEVAFSIWKYETQAMAKK
jgi:hypothetical protein